MHYPGETAEQRRARANAVCAAFTRGPEDIPTMADYSIAYEWIGRPLPTIEELRARGIPVREVRHAA